MSIKRFIGNRWFAHGDFEGDMGGIPAVGGAGEEYEVKVGGPVAGVGMGQRSIKITAKRYSHWIFAVVILLGIIIALVVIVDSNDMLNFPAISARYQAEVYWQDGRWLAAAGSYGKATFLDIDAGIRWSIARPFLEQSGRLDREGDLPSALATCRKAQTIIGVYDPEGVLNYRCYLIDFAIHNPTNP